MGTLRFLLAILVLLSHNAITIGGLNPGVMSVVAFYVISGYVMAALIERHYAQASRTLHFYADRILRIYPQYLLYALAAALWLFTVGHPTHFLNPPPSLSDAFNNLLIVPLNYYMFNGADRFTLVPPAWSLGAELLFYALAPHLWRHWRWAMALGLISLAIQAMAWQGHLNSDWWGYRLLPGVLWIFLIGMALHRYRHSPRVSTATLILPMALGLVAALLAQTGHLAQPYHREVLLGLALSVPLIHRLTSHPPRQPRLQNLDQQLGNWSYGIFLNHFLLMWVWGVNPPQHAWQWAALLLGSIGLSALTQYAVERPILMWRRRWRRV